MLSENALNSQFEWRGRNQIWVKSLERQKTGPPWWQQPKIILTLHSESFSAHSHTRYLSFVDTSTIFSWNQKHTSYRFVYTKFKIFTPKHTNSHFFWQKRLQVMPGTNLRYAHSAGNNRPTSKSDSWVAKNDKLMTDFTLWNLIIAHTQNNWTRKLPSLFCFDPSSIFVSKVHNFKSSNMHSYIV